MPASASMTGSTTPVIATAADADGNVALSFGTLQGNTTALFTATGSFTNNHLVQADTNGNAKDSGVTVSGLVLGGGSLTTQYGILYNTSTSGTVTQAQLRHFRFHRAQAGSQPGRWRRYLG